METLVVKPVRVGTPGRCWGLASALLHKLSVFPLTEEVDFRPRVGSHISGGLPSPEPRTGRIVLGVSFSFSRDRHPRIQRRDWPSRSSVMHLQSSNISFLSDKNQRGFHQCRADCAYLNVIDSAPCLDTKAGLDTSAGSLQSTIRSKFQRPQILLNRSLRIICVWMVMTWSYHHLYGSFAVCCPSVRTKEQLRESGIQTIQPNCCRGSSPLVQFTSVTCEHVMYDQSLRLYPHDPFGACNVVQVCWHVCICWNIS